MLVGLLAGSPSTLTRLRELPQRWWMVQEGSTCTSLSAKEHMAGGGGGGGGGDQEGHNRVRVPPVGGRPAAAERRGARAVCLDAERTARTVQCGEN